VFTASGSPSNIAGVQAALAIVRTDSSLRKRLWENVRRVRAGLSRIGYRIGQTESPIVPILIGDTAKAIAMSAQLLDRGVYVSGFGFPVVPQGQARLRCQISAAHTREHLDRAIAAIVDVVRSGERPSRPQSPGVSPGD